LKKFYVLRGVSGSGKTTFIKKLPKNSVVHSTDSFFYKGKKYRFDFSKLGIYHQKNLNNFIRSLKENKINVIIDNTNLVFKHVKPYIKEAKKRGYKVILVDFKPKGREWHYKRNVHNVSKKVLTTQIKNYKKYKKSFESSVDMIIKGN
jgi:predicted kinase